MDLKKEIAIFLDLFFPPRCPICDGVLKKQEKVCTKCKKELKWVREPSCFRCGKPVATREQEYCRDCRSQSFHYVRGYPLWLYEGAAKRSMAAFKYKGRQEYAGFYGEALMERYGKELRRLGFDTIIPVPVHKEKQRLRGYNQAELLAREIGKALKLPVEAEALLRVRSTKPQKGLNQKERQKNLERAFQCNPRHGKDKPLGRVLLVDDIYTTGSTIEACTRALLQAGAKEVYFITLCIGKGC